MAKLFAPQLVTDCVSALVECFSGFTKLAYVSRCGCSHMFCLMTGVGHLVSDAAACTSCWKVPDMRKAFRPALFATYLSEQYSWHFHSGVLLQTNVCPSSMWFGLCSAM